MNQRIAESAREAQRAIATCRARPVDDCSAPVSRQAPTGGDRPSGQVRLTPAQREAAAIAGVSDIEYAKQLEKLDALQEMGEYSGKPHEQLTENRRRQSRHARALNSDMGGTRHSGTSRFLFDLPLNKVADVVLESRATRLEGHKGRRESHTNFGESALLVDERRAARFAISRGGLTWCSSGARLRPQLYFGV